MSKSSLENNQDFDGENRKSPPVTINPIKIPVRRPFAGQIKKNEPELNFKKKDFQKKSDSKHLEDLDELSKSSGLENKPKPQHIASTRPGLNDIMNGNRGNLKDFKQKKDAFNKDLGIHPRFSDRAHSFGLKNQAVNLFNDKESNLSGNSKSEINLNHVDLSDNDFVGKMFKNAKKDINYDDDEDSEEMYDEVHSIAQNKIDEDSFFDLSNTGGIVNHKAQMNHHKNTQDIVKDNLSNSNDSFDKSREPVTKISPISMILANSRPFTPS